MSSPGRARGEDRSAQHVGAPVHQKVSVDARRRLVAQSLQVGNPGNNARDLPQGLGRLGAGASPAIAQPHQSGFGAG